MLKTVFTIIAGAVAGAFLTAVAMASDPSSDKAFEEQLRRVLMENPEILFEAARAYEDRQEAEMEARRRKLIAENLDAIRTTPGMHIAGNPNGKVLMVEFFDYHCGFCKLAMPSVVDMIENNKELGVAFVEFPFQIQDSTTAALAALAAGEQGKYFELHQAMMAGEGRMSKERILAMAPGLGIDAKKLEKDMNSTKIEQYLDAHLALVDTLGMDSTPAFIINGEPVTGWQEEKVKQLVKEAMAK